MPFTYFTPAEIQHQVDLRPSHSIQPNIPDRSRAATRKVFRNEGDSPPRKFLELDLALVAVRNYLEVEKKKQMLRETDNLTGGNAKREFKIPAFRDQGRMKVSFRKQWHQKQREKFLFKEAMTRFSLEGQEETVPMYIQIRSKPNEDAVAYKKEKEHRRKWLETYRQRAEETRR
jgi:hypothetical protein